MPPSDFLNRDVLNINRKQDSSTEITHCPNCNCNWFEQVTVNQYAKYHGVILGQTIPSITDLSFIVLRCIKCSSLVEPDLIQLGMADQATRKYHEFLDDLEGKIDLGTGEKL